MADTSGMADIRSLDIDKLVKGFADENLKLMPHVHKSSTSSTEIRWYQKTAGFLDTPDTSGITASGIYNTAAKSRPQVIEPSYTRLTSYVKTFKVESPLISFQDLNGCDPDVWGNIVRDLVRAVQKQMDTRVYNVLTESLTPSTIQTAACYGTGWADGTNGNPVADILSAKAAIAAYDYEPEGVVMYINPTDNKNLLSWLITTKGSSIPAFASARVVDGVVMNLLGVQVVVSNSATAAYAAIFVPQVAVTYKEFIPLSSATIEEPLIGKKFRVAAEGEALLTDPKAVVLLTNV